LCAGKEFIWHSKAPKGRSGGILLGIDMDCFDIGAIDEGEFYVKFHLCNKKDNFKWALVAVYGQAQQNLKEQFLTDLVNMCSHESLPLLIGGDYSILQNPKEKNNNNYNERWPFLFNAVIDGLNLRELEMTERKFTWANNLQNPTYEKLGRILMSIEWEQKFPLSTVQALNQDISDHTPLFLSTGEPSSMCNHTQFRFELRWLLRDGFIEMIKELWTNTEAEGSSMEIWQIKIRRVRQFLRGWAKNVSGNNRKEKKKILNTVDRLDKKAEDT
jgi:hypothetical protein